MTPAAIAAASLYVATILEGPFHVTPGDPGGPTAYGIALAYHPDLTETDLRAFTPQSAAAYLAEHYLPRGSELLPDCLAAPLLAYAVLETADAPHALQRALDVKVDGLLGPDTARAAASMPARSLLNSFFRECMRHLSTRPNWAANAVGWADRQNAASLQGI